MNRRLLAPASALVFVLAGCARSCAGSAPRYGAYVPDFAEPTWAPASYAAIPGTGTREEVSLDANHIAYVLDGKRTILTDRTSFRVIPGPEQIAYALPLPEEKGFLFVGKQAPGETWFAERFDGPLRSLGKGTPCRTDRMPWLNGPRSCQQKTSFVSLASGRAFPMTEDLVILFDEFGEHARVVSLPSGEPPPKGTPRAEDLFTLEDGLAFLRGPDGLFVQEPGAHAWKRIGSDTVTSITYDESGVVAYGSEGPTRLVETGNARYRSEVPNAIAVIVPETKARAQYPGGRFDRDTWSQETSRVFSHAPDACKVFGTLHDLLACEDNLPRGGFEEDQPRKARVYRLLPLPWEATSDGSTIAAPDPLYPGMPLVESAPELEWEGDVGAIQRLRSNEFGTLFQGMDCLGKKAPLALCERSGNKWQSTALHAAFSAIPSNAEISLLSAPANEIFVFAREQDGSLTIGLGRSGRLRRFPKDELPAAVVETLSPPPGDAGGDASGPVEGGVPSAQHERIARVLGSVPVQRSDPQFLVTRRSTFRIVGLYAANAKTYSIELNFDSQPELDTFDGYASFAGPYGLGLHQSGGLFESLDGAHSFVRVPAPPLTSTTPADGKTLHCYPAGCRIGDFERRGYGRSAPGVPDAGRDAK